MAAELSSPQSLPSARQQLANITFAVRGMATPYSFANQCSQLWRIFLQIQASRLAKRPPQGITDNLAGAVIKPALHFFFDNRLQHP